MIVAVLIVCASVLLYLVGLHWAQRRRFRALDKLPGPPHLPIIGSILEIGLTPRELYKGLMRITGQYGHIQKFWLGPHGCFVLTDEPDLIEHITSSPNYNSKANIYDYLKPWLSNGLLISNGEYWQKRRKAITPTFHFKILEEFVRVFLSQSDVFIERLSEKVDKGIFDIYPYVADYTLDTICESAMGTKIEAQRQPNNEYVTSVRRISDILIQKVFSPWKSIDFLYNFTSDSRTEKKCLDILHKFTRNIIEKRREELLTATHDADDADDAKKEDDVGMKRRVAFLDMLLKCTIDGQPLSNEDIREEVDTFMFEGHDTTASAISFTLYLLANNPDVQNRLVEELHELFGNELNRQLNINDLNSMKYTEAVLKETLRLYPSAALIGRELREDIQFNDIFIPKGVQVLINIVSMQRRPDLFDHPDEFRPERFLVASDKNPFSFIPFSAGPRNCIGQKFAMNEMKVAVYKILSHFEFVSAGEEYIPDPIVEVIMKSEKGICVQIKKRHF